MAIVLGTYIVNNDTAYRGLQDYAYGLNIPIQMGTNTFFMNRDMVSQLRANVELLLRTRQGEMLNKPLFGTKLHRVLFEPIDDEIEPKINEAIETAVAYWIPQLIVNNIEIDQSDEMRDKNQVGVKVGFSVKDMNASFDVNFKING